MLSVLLYQGVELFTRSTLPIACTDSLYLQFKLTICSKVPTQTHQLHYLASRTRFSDTITSYRKMSVLLKQSNLNFAEFFTSRDKI